MEPGDKENGDRTVTEPDKGIQNNDKEQNCRMLCDDQIHMESIATSMDQSACAIGTLVNESTHFPQLNEDMVLQNQQLLKNDQHTS
ncbi:UNVERIFIED_CONTAM: hypothetical protein Sradi_2338900 [Sesamum radiatum]|uniref:Uncharacterized protein n=1 Tax=Sesamum radiatum TaxID=300843 RepID=A0AAW2T8C9_SESRA